MWRLIHQKIILYFTGYLKPKFSLMGLLWMQDPIHQVPMLGRVYYNHVTLSKKDQSGVLEKGKRYQSGELIGFHLHLGNKFYPHKKNLPVEAKVACLMDPITGGWNNSLIDTKFLQDEATIIKGILLSNRVVPDRFIWKEISHGQFTVRSAFHMLKNQEDQDQASSSTNNMSRLWTALWSQKVPNKIKQFLWWVCNNALPVKTNLVHRKVILDATCDECLGASETITHALWTCPFAKQVWSLEKSLAELRQLTVHSVTELVWYILEVSTTMDIEIFAVIAWAIWQRRNSLKFQVTSESPDQVYHRALDLLQEFRNAHVSQTILAQSYIPCAWHPPPTGVMKIDFNGAMFKEENAAGIGVIVRSDTDDPIATLSKKIALQHSVEAIEAIESYSFVHIKRQGNAAAHFLARKAKDLLIANMRLDSLPQDIIPVLAFVS